MNIGAEQDAANAWTLVREDADVGLEITTTSRVHLQSLNTSLYLRSDSLNAMSWSAVRNSSTEWRLQWTGSQTATTAYALQSTNVDPGALA